MLKLNAHSPNGHLKYLDSNIFLKIHIVNDQFDCIVEGIFVTQND
jgi:hypothetical protein